MSERTARNRIVAGAGVALGVLSCVLVVATIHKWWTLTPASGLDALTPMLTGFAAVASGAGGYFLWRWSRVVLPRDALPMATVGGAWLGGGLTGLLSAREPSLGVQLAVIVLWPIFALAEPMHLVGAILGAAIGALAVGLRR